MQVLRNTLVLFLFFVGIGISYGQVHVDDDNNVVIGENTMTGKRDLDVTGTLTIRTIPDFPTSSSFNILVVNSNGMDGHVSFLSLDDILSGVNSGLWEEGSEPGEIFYDVGNVGIGTNNPTERFDVNGRARIRDVPQSNDNNVLVVDPSGNIRHRSINSITNSQANSSTVTAGNWYRIAVNNGAGKRANAEFTLRDYISGGGHSTLNFRVGIAYNNAQNMAFTLINHSYYYNPTFTMVRVLEKGTYDDQFVEVFCNRSGVVNYSIYDNRQVHGWVPVDWVLGSVPNGYTIHEYDATALFNVGNFDDQFTVARNGRVGLGIPNPSTALHIRNPSPVISLQDSDGIGNAQTGYIRYLDSGGAQKGWVGYGSTGSDNLEIYNAHSGGHVNLFPSANGGVGIGIHEPATKFHVRSDNISNGTMPSNGNFSNATATMILQNDPNNNNEAKTPVLMFSADGANRALIGTDDDNYLHLATHSSYNGIKFSTYDFNRMTILSNGNIGIGKNPSVKLDINGKARSASTISSDHNQTLVTKDYLDAQVANAGSSLWTANGNKIFNSNSGNVGIGTTNPVSKLHVKGSGFVARIESTTNNSSLILKNPLATSQMVLFDQNTLFKNKGTGDFRFMQGNSESTKMIIKQDGDVGIGTTTPEGKLDVVNGTNVTKFHLSNTVNAGAAEHGIYTHIKTANSGKSRYGIFNLVDEGYGVNVDAYGIYTEVKGYGSGKRNVGLVNTVYTSGNGSGTNAVGIANNIEDSNNQPIVGVSNTLTGNTSTNITGVNNIFKPKNISSGLVVGLKNFNDPNIQYSSHMMHGTHSEFTGTINGNEQIIGNYVHIQSGQSSDNIYGVRSEVTNPNSSSTYAAWFSGDVFANGSLLSSSDLKLKENIKDLDNALNLVSKLKVKTYQFKSDSVFKKNHFGFIAQEVRRIIPDIVKENQPPKEVRTIYEDGKPDKYEIIKKEKILSINYIELIPILYQAVQEQQAIIESYQEKTTQLEKMLLEMDIRLKKVEGK